MRRLLLYFAIFLTLPCSADRLTLSNSESADRFNPEAAARAQDIFSLADIELAIEVLPNHRALIAADQGSVDGVLSRVSYSESYTSNLVRVPTAIEVLNYYAFVEQGQACPQANDVFYLDAVIVRGLPYFDYLAQRSEANLFVASDLSSGIQMLEAGRGQFSIAPIEVRGILSQALGLQFCESEPIYQLESYIYLHKKNEHLVPRINDAIQRYFEQADAGEQS
ncbi:hypothetical protein [Salinibius halmophilus]|uniref:hypothetical protein n=1 Tax=Salinibius halmophilus TaxID=1853216 RepID=UPI001314E31D|nr:hypothetical protein [Salinibius halmophilus]